MIRQIHLARLPPPQACVRVTPAPQSLSRRLRSAGYLPGWLCLATLQPADVQHEACTRGGPVAILQYVHTGIITAELGVNVQAIWVQEGSSVYLGPRMASLLGCRTSADLGPEQLRALGIDNPDGLTL